ncbi:MAG: hypothetical protein Q8L78_00830 [Coxiellaceae bacterium]|nr:hypothetical protein [Coxiellaceae bacterium]
MKSLGDFLLAKERNAIIVAFLAALLPVFYIPTGFFAVIIVAFVTLQKGLKSGFWVIAWVALPAIAMLALRRVGLFDLLFLRCVMVWFFAALLHRYRAWNVVLGAMMLVGIVAALIVHAVIPDATRWWEAHLTTYLQNVIEASRWRFDFTAADFAKQLAPMATGLVAFFVAATLFFELLIARFWQTLTQQPKKMDVGFTRIRAGLLFAVLPCIIGLLAYFKQSWAIDVLPITLFPLCVSGLSFLHFWAYRKKLLNIVLVFIYVGMILVPVLVVAILAGIAFVDAVVHFRKRVV